MANKNKKESKFIKTYHHPEGQAGIFSIKPANFDEINRDVQKGRESMGFPNLSKIFAEISKDFFLPDTDKVTIFRDHVELEYDGQVPKGYKRVKDPAACLTN